MANAAPGIDERVRGDAIHTYLVMSVASFHVVLPYFLKSASSLTICRLSSSADDRVIQNYVTAAHVSRWSSKV